MLNIYVAFTLLIQYVFPSKVQTAVELVLLMEQKIVSHKSVGAGYRMLTRIPPTVLDYICAE